MPRFAILQHESPRGRHWDLLLEAGATLKTWALPRPPEPGEEIPCDALPDHRLLYLEYEGPVAGERGSVIRWDAGEYQTQQQSDEELVVRLTGARLQGTAVLVRTSQEAGTWRFRFLSGAAK